VSEWPPPLRESLQIPGFGRIELRIDERRVLFISERGEARRFDAHPILDEPGRLTHVTARDGRSALLARDRSDRLHVFDVERLVFRRVSGFERLRDAERLRLHTLGSGYLVISENGIAALDRQGIERWRLDGVTAGWRLLASVEGTVWLRDASGNVLGFDTVTGLEVGS